MQYRGIALSYAFAIKEIVWSEIGLRIEASKLLPRETVFSCQEICSAITSIELVTKNHIVHT